MSPAVRQPRDDDASGFASSSHFLSVTITQMPLVGVEAAVNLVLSRIKKNRFFRYTAPLDIYGIYQIAPLRGGAHPFKLVVYSPINLPNFAVMIVNMQDGWNSLAHLIAREHRQFEIQVTSTQIPYIYPANFLHIWRDGVNVRTVMAMRDEPKWVFFEKGEREPFENPAFYTRRAKKDRLNREIIIGYLKALGIDITSPDFWASDSDAIYYEETAAPTQS